jgi:protein-L-isoaspartate(D-aspartate) O-methyltransferase
MHFETARHQMIDHQIRPWDVSDNRVLAALAKVPRERFVPEQYRKLAFADTSIPLPCGQSMLKPVLEGRLLQNLDVQPDHRVLVIGTGSGFLTACVAQLAEQVTSIDIHGELVERAGQTLAEEQVHNVDLHTADFNTYSPDAVFDRVLLAASMPEFEPRLAEWLKPDGKLIAIVGEAPNMEVELVERNDEHYTRQQLFETVVQPLEGLPIHEEFQF